MIDFSAVSWRSCPNSKYNELLGTWTAMSIFIESFIQTYHFIVT